MISRYRSILGLTTFSVVVTGVGSWTAYQLELALFQTTTPTVWTLLVGFVEEAFVRLIPLVHLPFALLAGRFAYALGEQIHGNNVIGVPSLSRRTVVLLVVGYLALALAHIGYNLVV